MKNFKQDCSYNSRDFLYEVENIDELKEVVTEKIPEQLELNNATRCSYEKHCILPVVGIVNFEENVEKELNKIDVYCEELEDDFDNIFRNTGKEIRPIYSRFLFKYKEWAKTKRAHYEEIDERKRFYMVGRRLEVNNYSQDSLDNIESMDELMDLISLDNIESMDELMDLMSGKTPKWTRDLMCNSSIYQNIFTGLKEIGTERNFEKILSSDEEWSEVRDLIIKHQIDSFKSVNPENLK